MPSRQGSSDSTRPLTHGGRHDRDRRGDRRGRKRDHRRRQRTDDVHGRHANNSYTTDRDRKYEQEEAGGYLTAGLDGLGDRAHLPYSPFGSLPPPVYDDHRARERARQSPLQRADKASGLGLDLEEGQPGELKGDEGAGENPNPTTVSKWERWLGPWMYVITILTACGLLFAATCSADGWRVKVNVARVDLPNDVFARLLATAKSLGKSSTGQKAQDGVEVETRAARFVSAGYLAVGFWGWCVSRPDQSEYACSPTNAWYTMDDLLETASITNRIPSRAFHDGLIHGMVVYGPAMVLAMAATVPAGIHVWRRLIRNNRRIEAGIALHGTMFAGACLSLIAFAVSKALQMRLNTKVDFPVRAGSVPAMAGIASLFLFLGLAGSLIPVIYRRVKRQQELLGSWDDVQAAESTPLPTPTVKRGFSLRRKGTWKRMRRMTSFFGKDYNEDDDDYEEGRRRRRRRRGHRAGGGGRRYRRRWTSSLGRSDTVPS